MWQEGMRSRSQVVRQESAKLLYVGSIPTVTSDSDVGERTKELNGCQSPSSFKKGAGSAIKQLFVDAIPTMPWPHKKLKIKLAEGELPKF